MSCEFLSTGRCTLASAIVAEQFGLQVDVPVIAATGCATCQADDPHPTAERPTPRVCSLVAGALTDHADQRRNWLRRTASIRSGKSCEFDAVPDETLSVGGELARLIRSLGLFSRQGCRCADLRAEMDRLGPDGCTEHLDRLAVDLVDSYRAGGGWLAALATLNMFAASTHHAARILIQRAINAVRASEDRRDRQADPWLPRTRDERLAASRPWRRNLLMHVLPVAGNGVWQWHAEQITQRASLFNGRRVLAIAEAGAPFEIPQRKGERLQCDPPAAVERRFADLGMAWDEILVVPNIPARREVQTFYLLMESVQSTAEADATFYCHAKGVTRPHGGVITEWSEAMYRLALDHWPTVANALCRCAMAGAFRRDGDFMRAVADETWHYSGTFFWMRNQAVFSRDWKVVPPKWFGVEAWPGHLFDRSQCACLCGDGVGDLYDENTWRTLRPVLQDWYARRHGNPIA